MCELTPNTLLFPAQRRKLFKAKNEFSRLWGAEHVKAAMAELAGGEQEKGETSWKALIDPRYIRGTFLCSTIPLMQKRFLWYVCCDIIQGTVMGIVSF
jgi:hypothetical protein